MTKISKKSLPGNINDPISGVDVTDDETYRRYDPAKDLKAVKRIWNECGWLAEESDADAVEGFLSPDGQVCETLVATIDGEAECCVHGNRGNIQYLDEILSLGVVAAVTTSHVSRKLGFAKKLTADLVAIQAENGLEVSALGMFDQGFYNKMGFGTGSYEHFVKFDPATLIVDRPFRVPKRLTKNDFAAIHSALMARAGSHGSAYLHSKKMFEAELSWHEKPFGLGYYDGPGGTLSHFIWGEMKGEHGPYAITFRAYQNKDQLLELLALVKSLGDQVHQISMYESGELQIQDLLKHPYRTTRATRNGKFEQSTSTFAYWQMRILDLGACLAKTHLNTADVTFNLQLSDPIKELLQDSKGWQGIGGEYVITLGAESSAESGKNRKLPTLKASVNAFSRMWFGVQSASSLSITDDLDAETNLLRALDECLRLPKPHFGWDF